MKKRSDFDTPEMETHAMNYKLEIRFQAVNDSLLDLLHFKDTVTGISYVTLVAIPIILR